MAAVKRYIVSVELSQEMYASLEACALDMHCRKSDIIRWGLKEILEFFNSPIPVEHMGDDEVKTKEVIINGKEK